MNKKVIIIIAVITGLVSIYVAYRLYKNRKKKIAAELDNAKSRLDELGDEEKDEEKDADADSKTDIKNELEIILPNQDDDNKPVSKSPISINPNPVILEKKKADIKKTIKKINKKLKVKEKKNTGKYKTEEYKHYLKCKEVNTIEEWESFVNMIENNQYETRDWLRTAKQILGKLKKKK